jgi:hypothetical protein
MLVPVGHCLGGNPGLIRNTGDCAPGKNGLRQVIKDIGNMGVLVNSMNSLDHVPKVLDGENSWKMKMATDRAGGYLTKTRETVSRLKGESYYSLNFLKQMLSIPNPDRRLQVIGSLTKSD